MVCQSLITAKAQIFISCPIGIFVVKITFLFLLKDPFASWIRVGNCRYRAFTDDMNYYSSKASCASLGARLAAPGLLGSTGDVTLVFNYWIELCVYVCMAIVTDMVFWVRFQESHASVSRWMICPVPCSTGIEILDTRIFMTRLTDWESPPAVSCLWHSFQTPLNSFFENAYSKLYARSCWTQDTTIALHTDTQN